MPTYVYKIIDTGETVEVKQSIKDDALTEIDGRAVTRVPQGGIKTPAFVGRFSLNPNVERFLATGDPAGL